MFWDSFYKICQSRNVSPTSVCKAIGLSNAAATGWKNGTVPKGDVLVKLAEHLGCTTDELLGVQKKQPTEKQAALIQKLKDAQMSDDTAKQVEQYVDFLIAQQQNLGK